MTRVLSYSLLALLLLIALQAAYGLVESPYSDQDIANSLVDTWEVHAWWTLAVLGFLALVAFFALPLAFMGHEKSTRQYARRVLGLAVVAAILAYSSHAALTARTTRLTGQTFGAFSGLF